MFAKSSLLDAEIRNSLNTSLIGNSTAFSPKHLLPTGLLFDSAKRNAALTATLIGELYWQNSNLAHGSGASEIATEIPGYEVLDFSLEYEYNKQWSLYGGINNMLNEDYYSRMRADGIEPAQERAFYVRFCFEIR